MTNPQNILITGGAGFIGSYLTEELMKKRNRIIVFDNFSSGKKENIAKFSGKKNFKLIKGDLLNLEEIKKALENIDIVYHFAANPDVRRGEKDTKIHFEQNIVATYNLLEAMREKKVFKIVFASSSVVYGNAEKIPTLENYGPLCPASLYGASKLACEGLISAYCHTFGLQSWIFRLANIVGGRSDHGIIIDFIKKLRNNSKELEILGDGKQIKSYLYVKDCVSAVIFSVKKSKEKVNIFNIGSEDQAAANDIAKIIIQNMGLKNVKLKYSGGTVGWKGDVPKMLLSIEKLENIGWKLKYNSAESVEKTVEEILRNFNLLKIKK